ncbi:MAG: DNA replication and repair protein RecF [Chitinophagales bacterium]|nr:DNA replication and repair protein RecF [Chitinophagales bacterium]MDW8392721.1 DNA replication and repair protein RecF [Chitinophagales bacterium]
MLVHLRLVDFRCFEQAQFSFSKGINLIYGQNGIGKTSLLEAIHFLCLGKSFFAGSDRQALRHGKDCLLAEGHFDDGQDVQLRLFRDGKKQLFYHGLKQNRLADHVGRLPVVVAAPTDHLLVDESGSERRRFLDSTLAQIAPDYLKALLTYNRLIQQRNALLRQSDPANADATLLKTIDEQLDEPARLIEEHRYRLVDQLGPQVAEVYHHLSGGQERVSLRYESQCQQQPISRLLALRRRHDLERRHTSAGIHRDDVAFSLNDRPLRQYGSQGQKKTFTLALRLAQFAWIRQQRNQAPLLLVDDYADKLDEQRNQAFLNLLHQEAIPQVFLTHTLLPAGLAQATPLKLHAVTSTSR